MNEAAIKIEKEKARILLERYKMKIIGDGWLFVPFLSLFYLLHALYAYYRYKEYDIFLVIISLALLTVSVIANWLKEEWENGLWIKYEAHGYPEENVEFNLFKKNGHDEGKFVYREGYMYTDSLAEFYFYQILKIVCYLASIAGIIIIGFIAFNGIAKAINDASLKNIGVLIVILLAVIIFNQRK